MLRIDVVEVGNNHRSSSDNRLSMNDGLTSHFNCTFRKRSNSTNHLIQFDEKRKENEEIVRDDQYFDDGDDGGKDENGHLLMKRRSFSDLDNELKRKMKRIRTINDSIIWRDGITSPVAVDEIVEKKVELNQKEMNESKDLMRKQLNFVLDIIHFNHQIMMAIELQSGFHNHHRYLLIIKNEKIINSILLQQYALIGIDNTNEEKSSMTIGFIQTITSTTSIELDGNDGSLRITCKNRNNLPTSFSFRPISVQSMWNALQCLHSCIDDVNKQILSHKHYVNELRKEDWINVYSVSSPSNFVNEWNQMNGIISHRSDSPLSPNSFSPISKIPSNKEKDANQFRQLIRSKLKETMLIVDLSTTTTLDLRKGLEKELECDLSKYRSFISDETLKIYAQLDAPSLIYDHVMLGSEWNASNFNELKSNRITHILNVSNEIDNFYPQHFKYMNLRVSDDYNAQLLPHWESSYRFISQLKDTNNRVLVHCQMGVSRSASTVIAYGLKEYLLPLNQTIKWTKEKRSCIQPNENFLSQLNIYEGIIQANEIKNRLLNKSFVDISSSSSSILSSSVSSHLSISSNSSSPTTISITKTTTTTTITTTTTTTPIKFKPSSNSNNNMLNSPITTATTTTTTTRTTTATSSSNPQQLWDEQNKYINSVRKHINSWNNKNNQNIIHKKNIRRTHSYMNCRHSLPCPDDYEPSDSYAQTINATFRKVRTRPDFSWIRCDSDVSLSPTTDLFLNEQSKLIVDVQMDKEKLTNNQVKCLIRKLNNSIEFSNCGENKELLLGRKSMSNSLVDITSTKFE
ncbi:hypothetical protein SNEBB_003316 [Seison nebaliae]|nr:hypothetical protein SNEBB_003316 [Seison nebaliae]